MSKYETMSTALTLAKDAAFRLHRIRARHCTAITPVEEALILQAVDQTFDRAGAEGWKKQPVVGTFASIFLPPMSWQDFFYFLPQLEYIYETGQKSVAPAGE